MTNHFLKVLTSDRLFTAAHFKNIDWQKRCKQLRDDGIASLFYPKIESVKNNLPPDIVQFFRTCYENAIIFKDFTVQILKDIQPALSSTGTIVLTQGLALSETVYPEPMCRAMGDVDLFLPDGNMRRIRDIFLDYGFTPYRDYENVLEYNRIMVDLHEGLWGTDRFPQREYLIPRKNVEWQPSKLIPGFFVLSPEYLALHCAFHGVKHGFNKGIWDCDLVRLYNTGYLTPDVKNRQEYMIKFMAFEHLRQKKILPAQLTEKRKAYLSPFTGIAVRALVQRSSRPGFGQLLLAFLCPTFKTGLEYLIAIVIPQKRILQQMYGRSIYPVLVMKRVWNLMKYAGMAVLKWR